jgi:histidinol-phosphate phosphatase family protein
MTPRAFFFDRDGTVNVSPGPGYVLRWDDFHFMPGLMEMLAAVKARGWRTILVTSQQGVGKGLMTLAELDHIHAHMQQALGPLAFDAIYACTGLDGEDPRRKPSPLMLQEAASDHQLDLTQCWNIGDKKRDLEMGHAAGVPHNLHLGSPAFPDWLSVTRYFTQQVPL